MERHRGVWYSLVCGWLRSLLWGDLSPSSWVVILERFCLRRNAQIKSPRATVAALLQLGVLFPTAPHRDLSSWGAVPPALPCASLIPALPLSCPPFLHTSQSLSFFKTHLLTHCYEMFSDRCYNISAQRPSVHPLSHCLVCLWHILAISYLLDH